MIKEFICFTFLLPIVETMVRQTSQSIQAHSGLQYERYIITASQKHKYLLHKILIYPHFSLFPILTS